MNARVRARRHLVPKGLTRSELFAEWELKLSYQLVEHDDGHIEWTGPVGIDGDGVCRAPAELARKLAINKVQTVPRALWIIKHRKVTNLNLLAACRVPWCVAPEHRIRPNRAYRRKLRQAQVVSQRQGVPFDGLTFRIAVRERADARREPFRAYKARRAAEGRPLNKSYTKPVLSERQHEHKLVRNRAWYQEHREQECARASARYYGDLEAQRAAARLRMRTLRAARKATQAQQGTPP